MIPKRISFTKEYKKNITTITSIEKCTSKNPKYVILLVFIYAERL